MWPHSKPQGAKSQHNPFECPLTYPQSLSPLISLSLRSNVLPWATPQRFSGNWESYNNPPMVREQESRYPTSKFSKLSVAYDRPSWSMDIRNWNFTTRFIFVFLGQGIYKFSLLVCTLLRKKKYCYYCGSEWGQGCESLGLMWVSEDSFVQLLFSSYPRWVPEIELKLPGCMASAFVHWAFSLAHGLYFFKIKQLHVFYFSA